MLDTTNWAEYPFYVDGVKFVSKLDTNGNIYSQVQRLPMGVFEAMNRSAIVELIGEPSNFSREELENELATVNLGAHQALICLA